MKFIGNVKKGKLTLYDKEGFKRYLYHFDGDVEFTINSSQKRHSPQQNAYYRVICRTLSKELGYTENEMHKTLKKHFEVPSTKELTTEEFAQYIDYIIRWAAMDMGIVLPNPTTPHE